MKNNKSVVELDKEMFEIQSECEILVKKTQDEANKKIEKIIITKTKAYNKQYFFKQETKDNYPVATKFFKMNMYGRINYIRITLAKVGGKTPVFNFELDSLNEISKEKYGEEITKDEFEIIVNKHMKKIIDI